MKYVGSALRRGSLRAMKSRRSAPVLAGVAIGVVLAAGTAVPESAASITGCSFVPTAVTVDASDPQATTTFSWEPGSQLGLDFYLEIFFNESLVDAGRETASASGVDFPIGEPWNEEAAGSTFRADFYAIDSSDQKTGGRLCTFAITYASAGSGEIELHIDREHYLGRPSSVTELPDTV